MGRQTDNRISYIRKPMAEHGYLCLGLAGVGLLLCVAGMAFSVRSQGNTPVGALSMCFSSILFSVASLMYGWKSFKEEEKNYIFAKIGTILSGLLVIWWIVTILIGMVFMCGLKVKFGDGRRREISEHEILGTFERRK